MSWMIRCSSSSKAGNFLLHHCAQTSSGAHPLSCPRDIGALSLEVRQLGHEADHSPPSSAGVKNAWSCTSTPQYAFMSWCSVEAQGQLYLLPLCHAIICLFRIIWLKLFWCKLFIPHFIILYLFCGNKMIKWGAFILVRKLSVISYSSHSFMMVISIREISKYIYHRISNSLSCHNFFPEFCYIIAHINNTCWIICYYFLPSIQNFWGGNIHLHMHRYVKMEN
jgi:hypothetical protein